MWFGNDIDHKVKWVAAGNLAVAGQVDGEVSHLMVKRRGGNEEEVARFQRHVILHDPAVHEQQGH